MQLKAVCAGSHIYYLEESVDTSQVLEPGRPRASGPCEVLLRGCRRVFGNITVCALRNLSLHNLIGERLLIWIYLSNMGSNDHIDPAWFLVNDSCHLNAPRQTLKLVTSHLAAGLVTLACGPPPTPSPASGCLPFSTLQCF